MMGNFCLVLHTNAFHFIPEKWVLKMRNLKLENVVTGICDSFLFEKLCRRMGIEMRSMTEFFFVVDRERTFE